MFIEGKTVEGISAATVESVSEKDKSLYTAAESKNDKLVADQDHSVKTQTVSWKLVISSVIIIFLIAWVGFKQFKK